jgi:hypothetical protein
MNDDVASAGECGVADCGMFDTRLYGCGPRCPDHRPGPEPQGRYCAPLRCYCGNCPSWRPDTAHAITPTVLDDRAIASGQRRASPESYAAAKAAVNASKGDQASA